MRRKKPTAEELRQAAAIDPRHQEYPCWCLSCRGRWSIYRAPDCPYVQLFMASAALHRELSPDCHESFIRVGRAVPYGEAAPQGLSQHADSPFVQTWSEYGPDHPPSDPRAA